MMLHTKYQDSRPCGLRREDFFKCPYISYDPRAGPFFAQGQNLYKLGKGLIDGASCQILRP